MTLGARLKLTRKANKISIRNLANHLQIAHSTLYRTECNKTNIRYETGKKIERWLQSCGEPSPCDKCHGKGFLFKREAIK